MTNHDSVDSSHQFHFVGTPAPVPEHALLAAERAAGMKIPPRIRKAAAEWGWGTVADVFSTNFVPERPFGIAALAKRLPRAKDAPWALLGGDESRQYALYCTDIGGTTYFVLDPTGDKSKLIGEGEAALFEWLSGKGLDRLYRDPLGAPPPITWAVPAPYVEELLIDAFTSSSTEQAEQAIEAALAVASRQRVGWAALHLLMDPDFAVTTKRRKELVRLVLRHTKKNVWKSIRAQPPVHATIESLKKTGRFAATPATTISSPCATATASWSSAHDFLSIRATGVSGKWVLIVTSHGADGIRRTNLVQVLDAIDGTVDLGTGMNAVHSVHVDLQPASAHNDHLVRGVNLFFHEDGTVSELPAPGDISLLTNKSPLHREDGPAELYGVNWFWPGRTGWWRQGKLHREDGPAVVVPAYGFARDDATRGFTAYYFEGELHRERGPAKIYANGDLEWWTHGTRREETEAEAAECAKAGAAGG